MHYFINKIAVSALISGTIALLSACPAAAQMDDDALHKFSIGNPDGIKYEFVKTYIMALEYLYQNEKAEQRTAKITGSNIENVSALSDEQSRLVQANVNIRISRNLLDRYSATENGLVNKVVETYLRYAEKQLELNNQERTLIMTLKEKATSGTSDEAAAIWFSENIVDLSRQRKESSMDLLESSLMVNKVLISHRFNQHGELFQLGITREERRSLIRRLSAFREEGFDGGPRSGQTFLEASISAIRQLLEDRNWPASEEIS